jgi:catechol 2,3-dioxygenase-like lactoylglutathione lyase family enzyme
MSVRLNHTIIWCRDQKRSSAFLVDILGLRAPTRFGIFLVVQVDNDVSLDFGEADGEIAPQHYAFLIGEDDFDDIFGRVRARGLEHWADPGRTKPGAIYHHNGGRGVYFQDPDGHLLEILTRPYAAGG